MKASEFLSAVKKIKSSSSWYVHLLHCLYTLCSYLRSTCLFYALPKYLKDELVQVEKRAMSIICPGLLYQETIELVNIVPIVDFITGLCSNTFDTIIKDPEQRLNRLIQFSGPSRYALRCNRRFVVPKCKTDHFRNSLLLDPASIIYIRRFLVLLSCFLYFYIYGS